MQRGEDNMPHSHAQQSHYKSSGCTVSPRINWVLSSFWSVDTLHKEARREVNTTRNTLMHSSHITVCYAAGATKYKLGGTVLVVLGHLVSCFARDFSPAVPVQEAYIQLLSTLCSIAQFEHSSVKSGTACCAFSTCHWCCTLA